MTQRDRDWLAVLKKAQKKLITQSQGARFFCSRKNRYRSTTVRLNARRGSEQYHPTNSSMA